MKSFLQIVIIGSVTGIIVVLTYLALPMQKESVPTKPTLSGIQASITEAGLDSVYFSEIPGGVMVKGKDLQRTYNPQ